ncbi:PLP-dependent cysteine synthase family protein [Sphingomonas hankyongi]|uniref:L-cysteine desulfhydrase Cds1 n=1 Tax=Sphingomonas hankyongi TaxID=2908209 RepID=A0ABT0S157_9SPHN|nr:PLP-dependent cysteine synthase family protein [Sphingomonas hankyongi]
MARPAASVAQFNSGDSSARRAWNRDAIQLIQADYHRSADTHLILHRFLSGPNIRIYFKDESSHPTGSLKHRLARSLFLYALSNDWIGPGTTVIEASSGSTAVSEAYFARMLGLRFIAVVPRSCAAAKIALIRFQGGEIHHVDDPREVYAESARLAVETNGHYMDQFTYAERATDWRGNNNIAESIFSQLEAEPQPIPEWIVCGAGTGGTSATIGRFIRYKRLTTRLCLADPEDSIFHRHYADRAVTRLDDGCRTTCIEGIGRPRVEPSFMPNVIDRAISVSDSQSIAAMRLISERLGRRCGGSTGTNMWACAQLVSEMIRGNIAGSVLTLICDSGDRYLDTYFSDEWLAAKRIDWRPEYERLKELADGVR